MRRRLLIAFAAVLGLLLLVGGGGAAFLASDAGRDWIKGQLIAAISTPGETEVAIGGLEGPLPSTIVLRDVTVSDPAGVWLSADSLRLEWSPLALLSDVLRVSNLEIGELEVARLPETAEEEAPAEGPLIPELPFDLIVERVEIDRLALGEPLLGTPALLRVAGEATAESSDRLRAQLTVERTDGAAGRIAATALYSISADSLELELEANEPPGGLIARLLELPDLPALELTLEGTGALDDWQGRLAGSLTGLAAWDAALGLQRPAPADLRLSLDGSGQLTAPGDAPWAGLVGGELRYNLAALWDAEQVLTLEKTKVDSAALGLELTGRLDSVSRELTANALANLREPAAVADLLGPARIDGLIVELEAAGPMLQPELQATLRVAAPSAPGASAGELLANVAFRPERPLDQGDIAGSLAASGQIRALDLEGGDPLTALLGPDVGFQLDGRVEGGGTALRIARLDVNGAALRVGGTGRLDAEAAAVQFSGQLAMDDLTPLAPAAGLPLGGAAELSFDLVAPRGADALALTVGGRLRELRSGIAALDRLTGAELLLAGEVALAGDGSLVVDEISVDGARASLEGAVRLDPDFVVLEADYRVGVPDLGALAAVVDLDLGGDLSLVGRAAGPLGDPQLEGNAEIDAARVEGVGLGRVRFDYKVENPVSGARGRAELALAAPTGPVKASADFALAPDVLRLEPLRLSAEGGSAEGKLALPLDGTPASGDLNARFDDLRPWLGLAGLDAGGRGKLQARLAPDGTRQSVRAEAELADLRLESEDGAPLTLRAARLDLKLADAKTLQGIALSAKLDDLASGEVRLSATRLEAEGNLEGADFKLGTEGEAAGPLILDSAGRLAVVGDRLTVTLQKLEGRVLEQRLALRGPLTLGRSDSALELRGLDLAFGDGAVRGNAALDARAFSVEIAAENLPLALAGVAAPVAGIDGTIDGELKVAGPPSAPRGEAKLKLSEIKLAETKDVPSLDAEFDATWSGGRLRIDGTASGLGAPAVEMTAALPLRAQADPLSVALPQNEAISGSVSWRGDLAAIWPAVPVVGHRLAGAGEIDAEFAGTLAAPRYSGGLTIKGGSYENLTTGTLLEDLELELAIDERRLRVARLSATDGGDGRLEGEGSVELAPDRDFPFDIDAAFTEFALLRRDEVNLVTDGEVSLEGNVAESSAKGRFDTKLVEIGVPERLPPEVVELQVTELNREVLGEKTPPPPPPSEPSDVRLDIVLAMPGRVFVRGRGLDSEWSGELVLTGPANQPAISGSVGLVRGQLQVLNKFFTLTRGSVQFDGTPELDPIVDIVAEESSGGLAITASITGRSSRPTITLTSSPPLPQDEILSRVLFDKNTTELSALEAVQLADAAAELSGQGGGSGQALGAARDLLGLDVLRVEGSAASEAGPGVAAGKYGREDVYVGVKQGSAAGSGSVGVEVDVTPNISIITGVGQTGTSNIGLKWQWDY